MNCVFVILFHITKKRRKVDINESTENPRHQSSFLFPSLLNYANMAMVEVRAVAAELVIMIVIAVVTMGANVILVMMAMVVMEEVEVRLR